MKVTCHPRLGGACPQDRRGSPEYRSVCFYVEILFEDGIQHICQTVAGIEQLFFEQWRKVVYELV